MSLRRFQGWEPRDFTEVVEYAESGQPKRWVTRREPEWDDRQRLWMLALQAYEAGLCSRCGHHLAETTDPASNPDDPSAPLAWVAEEPIECMACKALARSQRLYGDEEKTRIPPEAFIHTTVLVGKTPR